MSTIFKFGGASIQDAARIKNVYAIVQAHAPLKPILVISALGKTTNALEEILNKWFSQQETWLNQLNHLKDAHRLICEELHVSDCSAVEAVFTSLEQYLSKTNPDKHAYDEYYDQVVAHGELASTKIIAAYFNEIGLACEWVDARTIIRTDEHFRDVNIDWQATEEAAKSKFVAGTIYVTQGFIGATKNNKSTTLGREGSDYTASILSYCLDATQMVIWKDVSGVMNADPKLVSDAQVLKEISYREAIEMTYFGAKVIHPKTIKPLQNKKIPLLVKCFLNPLEAGTRISEQEPQDHYPPIIVWKEDQVLLSIQDKDFSFIAEKHLTTIFKLFNQHRIHIHLMQNSAISFSVCVDANPRLQSLIIELQEQFTVVRNENMRLLTIRHYTEDAIARHLAGEETLVEQRSRNTIQLVTRKK